MRIGQTFRHIDGTMFQVIDKKGKRVVVKSEYGEIKSLGEDVANRMEFMHSSVKALMKMHSKFPLHSEFNTNKGRCIVFGYCRGKQSNFGIMVKYLDRNNEYEKLTIREAERFVESLSLNEGNDDAGSEEMEYKRLVDEFREGYKFKHEDGTEFEIIKFIGSETYMIRSSEGEIRGVIASELRSRKFKHTRKDKLDSEKKGMELGKHVVTEDGTGKVYGYMPNKQVMYCAVKLDNGRGIKMYPMSIIRRNLKDMRVGLATIDKTGHKMRIAEKLSTTNRYVVKVDGIEKVETTIAKFLRQEVVTSEERLYPDKVKNYLNEDVRLVRIYSDNLIKVRLASSKEEVLTTPYRYERGLCGSHKDNGIIGNSEVDGRIVKEIRSATDIDLELKNGAIFNTDIEGIVRLSRLRRDENEELNRIIEENMEQERLHEELMKNNRRKKKEE